MTGKRPGAPSSFEVSKLIAFLGRMVNANPRACIRAGHTETKLLKAKLEGSTVNKPVFICGLPRAGSTILLELLCSIRSTVSHRYRDFPGVFIPLGWSWFVDRSSRSSAAPRERAHADGIMVTRDSPEAMEEPLWMAFFSHLHEPTRSNVLGRDVENPAFENFFRDHIRKLLYLRQGTRYVSKGNYNITRMSYLLRLYPDARFVIPVRNPVSQVASMMRQHTRFSDALKDNKNALSYLRAAGHFEFGPERVSINPGDTPRVHEIEMLWRQGDDIHGWARYWNLIYTHVLEQIENDQTLRRAVLAVCYETLCSDPEETLQRVLAHCDLQPHQSLSSLSERLRYPDYYKPGLSPADLTVIEEETQPLASRFGYEAGRER